MAYWANGTEITFIIFHNLSLFLLTPHHDLLYLKHKEKAIQLTKKVDIMETYTMTEKQNPNSHREGQSFEAKNLTDAKRKASRLQCFHGTVIELEQNGLTVAVKEQCGKWINQSYFDA